MERGEEWEAVAVRRRWRELERRQRAATRALAGLTLGLFGTVLLVFGLIREACVIVGPWPQGCVGVVPPTTRAVFLVAGPLAVLSGLLVYRTRPGAA